MNTKVAVLHVSENVYEQASMSRIWHKLMFVSKQCISRLARMVVVNAHRKHLAWEMMDATVCSFIDITMVSLTGCVTSHIYQQSAVWKLFC